MKNQDEPRDWATFWGTIWFNLFHLFGLVFVFGGGALFALYFLAPSLFSGADRTLPDTSQRNAAAVASTRLSFQKSLLRGERPCAKKKGAFSDLDACRIFDLRPRQTSETEVTSTVDASGYFGKKARFIDDSDGGRLLVMDSGGISLHVETKNYLVEKIILTTPVDLLPYFESKQLHATILEMVGPPDVVASSNHAIWGRPETPGELYMRAYQYNEKYWIVFARAPVAQVKAPDEKVTAKTSTK